MAGSSALLCVLLCAFAHGFPLPDGREAAALAEVTFSNHFKDDQAALDRTTLLIIISMVTFAIALGIFMTCVYFFLHLLDKKKSPENSAEAFTGDTPRHCGNHLVNLQHISLRCASPSSKRIELSISCDDPDEDPCDSRSPSPDMDEDCRPSSVDG